jgi:hypothetical protein
VGHRVCGGVYRRRQPEGRILYRAVRENLATLREEAAEVGRGLPWYVERDFSKYLGGGVLAHGFSRVRCEGCKDELLGLARNRCSACPGTRTQRERVRPATGAQAQ